ncbi:hypothetical protein DFH07DRAFT_969069 [Mycena maculata]|uniref:NB-ARC domain-containing protein n=1 Tax=Mycena maculata TaxID=230809 RepID=A0AAD7HZ58_9AGAR|nr:hypothetical protein DFH07DRAFT_969069 [Mycena maculata]
MPPAPPQIFHGRESELADVVNILLQNAPRVALLGPGGIGKTCLAKSVMHHPDIVLKYPDQYFVSCESAETVEDLALAVATALGMELTGKLSRMIVKQLSSTETRSKVEEFLSVLADLSHVALLITMRGQERPLKIRWTRPFIPALKPLSSDAAERTFTDIAGVGDAAHLSELLALTGNLPLAVTLMATVASYEGCETVLSRWKSENVSLLSDGFDKGTNLETSLRISLSSPRMTSSPGALRLLSLLSLLPDGILDADLLNHSSPIPQLLRSKSTLLRTSLAYIDVARLKVLAPVRELIRKIHPPSYTLVRPLRLHWDGLLKLWKSFQMPLGDLLPRLVGNIGNLTSLLKQGLDVGGSDLKEVLYGIFYLDQFTRQNYGNYSLLMVDIATHIERVDDNQLRGYYILHLFKATPCPISPSEAPDMIEKGCRFFQLAEDLSGESRLQLIIAKYYLRAGNRTEPSIHAEISLSLAEQADDNFRRTRALCTLAACKGVKGEFRQALLLARKAQYFAGRVGNFQHETEALMEEAGALVGLGNFSQVVEIGSRARQLVVASCLEGTEDDLDALDLNAYIHLYKTAYVDSRRAHELILQHTSPKKYALFYGNALTAIASIDVALGALKTEPEVLTSLIIPRQIFASSGYLRGLPKCDIVVADFLLTKGRHREAKQIYEKCVPASRGDTDSLSACMRKLGDLSLWEDLRSTKHWATTYLAHGQITRSAPAVSWAFRLLGDIFLHERDDQTSATLFRVALEEFTRMDIYRGKAECFMRLGELALKTGQDTVAKELFSEARRMFLGSGMTAEAEQIDIRLLRTVPCALPESIPLSVRLVASLLFSESVPQSASPKERAEPPEVQLPPRARSRPRRIVSTVTPSLLTDWDHLDFSGIDGGLSFPRTIDSHLLFLYFGPRPGLPSLAASLFFRCTPTAHPSSFDDGHDLLLPDGLPWQWLPAQAAVSASPALRDQLVHEGHLTPAALAKWRKRLSWVEGIKPRVFPSNLLFALHQPSAIDFGRSINPVVIGKNKLYSITFRYIFAGRAGGSIWHPFKGA